MNSNISILHRLRRVGVFTALGLVMSLSLNAEAQYNFTILNAPGAVGGTEVRGISGNNIVGYYTPGNTFIYGFLYDGTNYTTLDSGTPLTLPLGVSGTDIVGYEGDTGYLQGFLYNGSSYTTLTVPGQQYTYASGIFGTNIVGYYGGSTFQGFLYNGTTYTTLSVAGAVDTYAMGISGTNIVGYYDTNGVSSSQGFLYNGTTFTTLSVPGASQTYATGIDGNNVVGFYFNSNESASYQGFVYDGSSYTTVNAPGAVETRLLGISGTNIVGDYFDGSGWQGFVATPVSAPQLKAVAIDGMFQLTVSMAPPYSSTISSTIIQTSTDLLNWENIYTNTPPYALTNSMVTTGQRFYRALLGP